MISKTQIYNLKDAVTNISLMLHPVKKQLKDYQVPLKDLFTNDNNWAIIKEIYQTPAKATKKQQVEIEKRLNVLEECLTEYDAGRNIAAFTQIAKLILGLKQNAAALRIGSATVDELENKLMPLTETNSDNGVDHAILLTAYLHPDNYNSYRGYLDFLDRDIKGNHDLYLRHNDGHSELITFTPTEIKVYYAKNSENEQFAQAIAQALVQPQLFRTDDEVVKALRNLWLTEAKKLDLNKAENKDEQQKQKDELNPDFLKILNIAISRKSETNNRSLKINFSYDEMVKFYHEIHNGTLTSETTNVQNWLFSNTDSNDGNDYSSLLAMLKLYPNFDRVQNSIKQVDRRNDKEANRIYHQIMSDRNLKGDIKLTFYKIDEPHKPKRKFHFQGIHGTQAYSVPYILFLGLLNSKQRAKRSDIEYEDTAQSLGDGIYFAREDQCAKSIAYSDGKYRTLFVVDTEYNKPFNTDSYGTTQKDHDFVAAKAVGFSMGYDEYVAVDPQKQCTLRYLIVSEMK